MVAGLLHDLGKVVLAHLALESYDSAMEQARSDHQHIALCERAVFSVDHTRVNRWLADEWHFPKRLSQPIVYHHRERVSLRKLWRAFREGQYWTLIALKYRSPQMSLTRVVSARGFKIARELMRLLGAIWGLIRYSYKVPGKLLRQVRSERTNAGSC